MSKSKKHRGRFRKGHDPRRHELTAEERQRGYRNALAVAAVKDAQLYAWLWRKVRGYYRGQREAA